MSVRVAVHDHRVRPSRRHLLAPALRRRAARRSWRTPGFGRHFTDHMVTIKWTRAAAGTTAQLVPYGPLSLDPADQGPALRAGDLRGPQGLPPARRLRRHLPPGANAARFQRSARRLAMPELPVEIFIEACDLLVRRTRTGCPAPAEETLYLRPFMIATEVGLGVKPANEYLPGHRLAGRRLLPRWRQAGLHLAVRGVRPRRPRRHGRRQERRQLRGLPARAGRGHRERLRPGRLPRRGRAHVGRGARRHEPVLRVRRPDRHPGADRLDPGGRHP